MEIDENLMRLGNLIQFRNTEIATLTTSENLNRNTENDNLSLSEESDKIKGFVKETAEKLGVSERTIEREIQIATNLSEEVKQMIWDTELADRKEIYEELHPETRKGYASLGNLKQFRNTEILPRQNFGTRSFVAEVSEKLGVSGKTIYEYLEIGQRITGEVEDMIRGTELEDRKKDLLAISRLDPEEQKYVVKRFLEKGETVKEVIEELKKKKRLQKAREKRKELEKLEKESEEQEIKIIFGDMRILMKDVPDNSVLNMEIDENLMRAELRELERMELLKRRKEIYEELYPQTRKGYASLKNLKQFRNTETPESGVSVEHPVKHRGFVEEISEKTGLSKSLIWEEIQIATNLSEEVKQMIWDTELADRKTDLLEISRK